MRTITLGMLKDWITYSGEFSFEVKYSKGGVARVFVSDGKTPIYAGGYGYDKESQVIAQLINDVVGNLPYNANKYGNRGRTNKDGSQSKRNRYLCGGTGFSSIEASFNSVKGCKLTKVYGAVESDIYSIKLPKRIKDKIKESNKAYYDNRMAEYGY